MLMSASLLVVDDHAAIRTMLVDYFSAKGYTVETATNGREALSSVRRLAPDLVVLDVMMPELDGMDVLRHLRRESTMPVILLTAKVEETDKVIGLELGADDYVVKPFGLRELEARIRAVLRRSRTERAPEDHLRAADLTLDVGRHEIRRGDDRLDLTPTEFTILETLLRAPGRVFSRAQLLERLQGDEYVGSERTMDVHIRNLRSKIEPDPKAPRYILTVFGVGYRFADG